MTDEVAAVLAEVHEMNADDWSVFADNGVTPDTEVALEFAFSAPHQEAAEELVEHLEGEGCTARAGAPESDLDDWRVQGSTPEVTVTAAGLDEWLRRMAVAGDAHGGCALDGWSALL